MALNQKTLLTVKTDKKLKKAAQKIADEIGIPLGTLVNSFLKQFVSTKEITFSAAREYPSASLKRSIAIAEREYAEGKLPVAHNIEELMKELNS